MGEQPLSAESTPTVSRRKFVRMMAGAALSVTAGERLTEGVIFRERPLYIQKKSIDDLEMLTASVAGLEGALFRSGNELLFDPRGDFFTPGMEIEYVHRTNRPKSVGAALELGATMFDIDIINSRGDLYADHGLVPEAELKLGRWVIRPYLPVVIDVDERGFKLGKPKYRYEKAVAFIRDKSIEEGRQLAVAAELKRGAFDTEEVYRVLDTHQEFEVPVIIHSKKYEHLMQVGEEIAYADSPS